MARASLPTMGALQLFIFILSHQAFNVCHGLVATADRLHEQTGDVIIPPQDGSDSTTSVATCTLFEGDILVSYQDIVNNYGSQFAETLRKSGFLFLPERESDVDELAVARSRRWPARDPVSGVLVVPYGIQNDPHFDSESRRIIRAALSHIEDETGVVNFVERTTEATYILFAKVDISSCWSRGVGYQSWSAQPHILNLGWCHKRFGAIVHETLHALGFWHEQSRPDRDDFVAIVFDNILSGTASNFRKRTNAEVDSLGSIYDLGSIMHYPDWAFQINPTPTIVPLKPLPPGVVMGQRDGMSTFDVEQFRLLYQCSSGSRSLPISAGDLCTTDCPCWENAPGTCVSDDECQGELVCGAAAAESTETRKICVKLENRCSEFAPCRPCFGGCIARGGDDACIGSAICNQSSDICEETLVGGVVLKFDRDSKKKRDKVKLDSEGIISVAVLSTPTFDATTSIDISAVTFGVTGQEAFAMDRSGKNDDARRAARKKKKVSKKKKSRAGGGNGSIDFNCDGLDDVILYFHWEDTGCCDNRACDLILKYAGNSTGTALIGTAEVEVELVSGRSNSRKSKKK